MMLHRHFEEQRARNAKKPEEKKPEPQERQEKPKRGRKKKE